jgi:hypothetical protein
MLCACRIDVSRVAAISTSMKMSRVRDLAAPMHLGLFINRPFEPHVQSREHRNITEAPDDPQAYLVGLRECEIKLPSKFIFPRNMLDYRMLRGSVVWEPQLPLNRDLATFYLLSLTDSH